jgi:2-dehydro-3-deoxy-D-arabinonate dehydratase
MKLYRTTHDVFAEAHGHWYQLPGKDWNQLVNRPGLYAKLYAEQASWRQLAEAPDLDGTPPIGDQEVWAAGVTYLRSKIARMEEAEAAGGGDFYDRVYDADRPEIFFKATAARTVGHGQEVYIRRDSTWDVPEPELTLFICSTGTIEGYTIGNDMSSRSIEGENPLYLPQAKTYDRCAALGPCLYVPSNPLPSSTVIRLSIMRGGKPMCEDSVEISQMKRTHEELVLYLFRECHFPHGCYLMTGTCLVPDHPFTLQPGDEVSIEIEPIGTLVNRVARRGA